MYINVVWFCKLLISIPQITFIQPNYYTIKVCCYLSTMKYGIQSQEITEPNYTTTTAVYSIIYVCA